MLRLFPHFSVRSANRRRSDSDSAFLADGFPAARRPGQRGHAGLMERRHQPAVPNLHRGTHCRASCISSTTVFSLGWISGKVASQVGVFSLSGITIASPNDFAFDQVATTPASISITTKAIGQSPDAVFFAVVLMFRCCSNACRPMLFSSHRRLRI